MARKSRKQTAAPMPAPSLYVHVALYIRLSVEDNKKRGCSVENQKLVLNDFLSDKPDFVVYDTYIDNGATGTNFHRPGFQQMLSDIEAGHINCVIVKDLSRLGRNSIDTGYYIEQYFHAHNVRFIAVTDQFDTEDSGNLHGGIMLPLKNMINEAYALDIGRKIKAQARQAMKDGDYIGARAPYGYRKDPDNCHKLLIDENTAPVVKQIFEWAHEHVSLNRIVRNLNEMGIPAPSHYKKDTGEITSPGLIGSGKWQTRTVMKILESEVYTGDLVQGKTKIVDHQQVKAGEDNLIIAKCTHEPIISYELFNAVQEYRKQICEESKATPKRPYTPNIFKGKVFCADCGRSLHRQRAERRKGPDTYWFHCLTNSRVEKDSCKGATMQEKELISTVTAILEKELTVALGMSLPLFQLEARQKQEKDMVKHGYASVSVGYSFTTMIAVLLISIVFSAVVQTSFQHQNYLYRCCRIYSMICCVLILWQQVSFQNKLAQQEELSLQKQLWMRHQAQYERASDSVKLINHKCHALKCQLSELKKIVAQTGNAPENTVLQEIENSVSVYDSIIETGNEILDTILTEKSLLCAANDITFTCVADGKAVGFLEAVDLFSMIGNALDNAEEAVRKLEDHDKRAISVSIFSRHGIAILQVENFYEGDLRFVDGLPVTTKGDPNYHGFGLKSIRSTAEKYGGTVSVQAEDGLFLLRVALPVETE